MSFVSTEYVRSPEPGRSVCRGVGQTRDALIAEMRRRSLWGCPTPSCDPQLGGPFRTPVSASISLPRERLEADLRYVSQHLPGVLVSYHDPNFGIRIDQNLDIIETLPENARNRYVMESSLSVLRGPRLPRLRATNCIFAALGVEAWGAYSNKSGVGLKVGEEKLARLIDHFEFRAFHEGRSDKLPAFYRRRYTASLGRYSELISEAEMRPVLEPPSRVVGSTPARSGERGVSRIDRRNAVAGSSSPSAPEGASE